MHTHVYVFLKDVVEYMFDMLLKVSYSIAEEKEQSTLSFVLNLLDL